MASVITIQVVNDQGTLAAVYERLFVKCLGRLNHGDDRWLRFEQFAVGRKHLTCEASWGLVFMLVDHGYVETMEVDDDTSMFRITRKGRHALETMERSALKQIGSEGEGRQGRLGEQPNG